MQEAELLEIRIRSRQRLDHRRSWEQGRILAREIH